MRIDDPPASGLRGVRLRQLERSDLPAWFDCLSMPAVTEHTSWNVQSIETLEALLSGIESSATDSPRSLAIVGADDGFMGTIGFRVISEMHRTAELGYELAPAHWGRGIGTAVCEAVTAWSFARFGFIRVQATVLETNRRSERVLLNCRFRYEGLLRAYRQVRGRPGNFKMYARLESD